MENQKLKELKQLILARLKPFRVEEGQVVKLGRMELEHAIELGEYFIKAKEACKGSKGAFEKWCGETFKGISGQTIRRWKQLAKAKRSHVSSLEQCQSKREAYIALGMVNPKTLQDEPEADPDKVPPHIDPDGPTSPKGKDNLQETLKALEKAAHWLSLYYHPRTIRPCGKLDLISQKIDILNDEWNEVYKKTKRDIERRTKEDLAFDQAA